MADPVTTATQAAVKEATAKRWLRLTGQEAEGAGKSVVKGFRGIGNAIGVVVLAPLRVVLKFIRTPFGGGVTALAAVAALVYGAVKLFGGKKEDAPQAFDARDSAAQLRAARVQAFSGEVNDLANEGNLARLQARQASAEVGAGQAR